MDSNDSPLVEAARRAKGEKSLRELRDEIHATPPGMERAHKCPTCGALCVCAEFYDGEPCHHHATTARSLTFTPPTGLAGQSGRASLATPPESACAFRYSWGATCGQPADSAAHHVGHPYQHNYVSPTSLGIAMAAPAPAFAPNCAETVDSPLYRDMVRQRDEALAEQERQFLRAERNYSGWARAGDAHEALRAAAQALVDSGYARGPHYHGVSSAAFHALKDLLEGSPSA